MWSLVPVRIEELEKIGELETCVSCDSTLSLTVPDEGERTGTSESVLVSLPTSFAGTKQEIVSGPEANCKLETISPFDRMVELSVPEGAGRTGAADNTVLGFLPLRRGVSPPHLAFRPRLSSGMGTEGQGIVVD